jgi:ADP-ribose pyrophosphatase
MTMEPWKVLDRSVILDRGKYLKVENHSVQLPEGTVISDWLWLVMPEYVNIIAETVDHRFLVFRQMKYAVGEETLAPIGGYCEPGEDPKATAARELLEETGFSAMEWTELSHTVVDGNRGAGVAHLFLARGAHRVADPSSDDLEEQELLFFTRKELEYALQRGKFKVLAWTACVALALLHPQR